MPTFELVSATKAKLQDVRILSQKNRPPDSNPGVALSFSAELPNTMLVMFDPSMLTNLYYRSEATEEEPDLPGVPPSLPNLTPFGLHIGRFNWKRIFTGYETTFDYGVGGERSNIVLDDGKVDDIHIHPKEGGTFILQWKVEINDVDGIVFSKVAMLKAREVHVLMKPQVVEPSQVTDPAADVAWPFPNPPKSDDSAPTAKGGKGKKAKTPEEALIETQGAA